jgi:hypothetical protein
MFNSMYHRASSAVLIVLAAFVFGACSSGEGATTGDGGGAAVVASEWGLQGDGSETTDPMDLPAGTATIQCRHESEADFAIDIVDADGTTVQQLRSQGGTSCAGMTYTLEQAGTYQMRVTADGPWEIVVTAGDTDDVTEVR